MKRLKILITNDDGIGSLGIIELARVLSADHDVTVVAPESERSAFSHAISIHKHVKCKKAEDFPIEVPAFTVDGTPADCVKFAALHISRKFDLVVSGINRGPNIGSDIMYSGTVSAAKEGAYMGMRSIAVSQLKYFTEEIEPYVLTAQFIGGNLERIYALCPDTKCILNINHPGHKDVRGVRLTAAGVQVYDDNYVFDPDKDGYMLTGRPIPDSHNPEDCDVVWSRKDYITITPLTMNLTDTDALKAIRKVNPFE